MVLRSLNQLYDRLEADDSYDVAPPGRSYQKISFVIVIESDGTLVDIQDARIDKGSRRVARRVLVLGQNKPRGSGLNPCFLWDSLGYLLGWDPDVDRAERATKTHEASCERHASVESCIDHPGYSAVCRFLEGWSPKMAVDFPILGELSTGFGVFQIRGKARYVHDELAIQGWWDTRTSGDPTRMCSWWEEPSSVGVGLPRGQCLVSGKDETIARLHPMIKGVAGSQPSGASLAGFNDSAYWSYGLEQSFNAPVSVEAARRYAAALNILLDRRDRHSIVVGATTVAFWTNRPTPAEDVFALFASEGSSAIEVCQDEVVRAKLHALMRALREGREAYGELADEPDRTEFFILGLAAPTPARVAVRFFHRSSVAELLDNLRRHHSDIRIERQFGEGSKRPEPELPALWQILNETKPPGGKIPPLLPGTLMEAMLAGKRYPESLFRTLMRRVTADRTVNYYRACSIKGVLVRNHGREIPVSLDTARTEPAYLIGRLFAALEKTQADALGGQINSTIRDRFYASASATPQSVFPRLLRTYQHHLAKLEGGRKISREKLVQVIVAPLEEFPTHLGLADQGLFALGYYHQRNDFYRARATTDSTDAD